MLELVRSTGPSELATVHVGRLDDGEQVEYVESVQPPLPREEKWVLIVSTLRGCPVRCPICDAGLRYAGRLSADEIQAQIDALLRSRYPDGVVPVPKLKVQFARVGDPAFNPAVLQVLRRLPGRYDAPGLMPCISTIAPRAGRDFLEALIPIKERLYPGGRFQMQFSLHTTDEAARAELVPARTLSFAEMAAYGARFFAPGDRKLTLNFAPVQGAPLDPEALARVFDPARFLVKLTPVNPTRAATARGLRGVIDPEKPNENDALVRRFQDAGFDTLLSIGELEENRIGSNCGMYLG